MNAKYFRPSTMWWVDFSIIFNNYLFLNQQYTNNFYLQLSTKNHFYYYLLILNHINSFVFYILDSSTVNLKKNQLIINHQSIFFDYQVTTLTNINKKINSISKLNKGSTWLEREDKELNKTNYTNLADSRKLLLNYNYNLEVSYTGFNQIISDIYL
jgi:hypothetical protein